MQVRDLKEGNHFGDVDESRSAQWDPSVPTKVHSAVIIEKTTALQIVMKSVKPEGSLPIAFCLSQQSLFWAKLIQFTSSLGGITFKHTLMKTRQLVKKVIRRGRGDE